MTTFLNDAQLALMRADIARMLPGTVVIQSVALADDGMGGKTETWSAVTGGTVAARLDPLPARTVELVAAAEGFKVEYQLTIAWDAPLAIGDRIVYLGDSYEVRQLARSHSWSVSRRALLARVE